MKKAMILVLIMLLAVPAVVLANGSSESASSVKLGFIGPMTGDNANYGVLCDQATKLAIDEFNAAGGIDGIKVELITEDSEGNVEKGLSAIEKLSSSDKITALVGPVFTGVSFAVGDRCQDEGIPMVTPSATHKDITAIGDYVFRTVPSDGLQGEVAGTYFAQALGYKNIAVLYAKNDYSQGLYEGMKASFEACGGKVEVVETCQVGDKDFKTQLTKIKAASPDAIYIPNYTAEMAQILEQASQLGVTCPFLSGDGFSNPDIYNLAANFCDGVVYIGPTKVAESEAYSQFVAKYEKAYGVQPDSFATNAYDAANIILKALQSVYAQTKGFDRAAVRDAIAATKDYAGVGGIINFAANGDLVAYQGVYKVNGTTPEYLGAFTVVNGQLTKVE